MVRWLERLELSGDLYWQSAGRLSWKEPGLAGDSRCRSSLEIGVIHQMQQTKSTREFQPGLVVHITVLLTSTTDSGRGVCPV